MKTWQVFAVIGAIVGVGWLLFRRSSSGSALVPGTPNGVATGTSSNTSGPPSSTDYTSMSLWDAASAIFQGANSGQASSDQVVAAQQKIIDAARASGLPIATGPATETRTGRGHF